MRFGLTITPDDTRSLGALAQLMEQKGYALLGMADSQSLFREAYVSLTVCALASTKLRLGPTVTNPITRHPAVTASAIASLDEVSGGRAFLGIGSGDSAIYNLGQRLTSLETLRRAVVALKTLMRGEQVEFEGRPIHTRWIKRPVPLWISAEGPKTLELAGELCDGVIVGTGLTPEVVDDSLACLERGASKAGRRLSDLDVWWFAKANVADTRERAIAEIKMALAASANHAFRVTLEGKHVPAQHHAAIRALQQRYAFHQHEYVGTTLNAALSDELGLTDYLAERFAVVGTPEDCAATIEQLRRKGISQILLTAIVPDRPRFVRDFADRVMQPFLR
jgi:5,10-methylenetetrahydromethanopterin reductase